MGLRATNIVGEKNRDGWKPVYYGTGIGARGTKLLGYIKKVGSRYHYCATSGESGTYARQREAIGKLGDFAIRVAVNVLRDPPVGRPVANRHSVPKRTWTRWSRLAQRMFNEMMDELRPKMQAILSHPAATLLSKDHWEALRWNIAWTAASSLNKLGR